MESSIPNTRFQSGIINDRLCGALLALAVHGAIFMTGSLIWMRKAEYGVDASSGLAEVDLVSAPAPMKMPSAASTLIHQEPAQEVPAVADKEDVATSDKTQTPSAPPTAAPVPKALLHTNDLNGLLGDGRSPIPGTDATTIHRAGSSGSYSKPGYYRNPPPPYPDEARKLKQEGRVLLEVQVTAEGKVGSLNIQQSSGFPLLDQAALQGVKNWRFRPATVGGLRMESIVEIPIRFQLK